MNEYNNLNFMLVKRISLTNFAGHPCKYTRKKLFAYRFQKRSSALPILLPQDRGSWDIKGINSFPEGARFMVLDLQLPPSNNMMFFRNPITVLVDFFSF